MKLGTNIYYRRLDQIISGASWTQVGLQENNFVLIWSSLLTNEKRSYEENKTKQNTTLKMVCLC